MHSKPLHELGLISFLTITDKCCHGNFFVSWTPVMPWQHVFLFLRLKCLSRCSLHAKPLHGLVLISFSMMSGNECCHANTFFVSWIVSYFMGSLLSIPLHRLELISFSSKAGNTWQHFAMATLFLGLKSLFTVFFTLQPPAWIGAD